MTGVVLHQIRHVNTRSCRFPITIITDYFWSTTSSGHAIMNFTVVLTNALPLYAVAIVLE